ncbi:MAG: hypothetical protein ACE5NP_04545 [Anaerolineae bacterium]
MTSDDIKQKLIAAKLVVSDPRLRTLLGKEKMLVEEGNVYGEKVDAEQLHQFLDQVFDDEVVRKSIVASLHDTALSVEALAEKTGMRSDVVFKHILVLQQKGQVEVDRVENGSPLYKRTRSE